MKGIWRKIQVKICKVQLSIITNALFQPKAKMGAYLATMSFLFLVAVPGMLFIAFFFAALIILNFEIGAAQKTLIVGTLLASDVFIFFLMFRGYMAQKRLDDNGHLNEAEIWELQNQTQAKLKALTDA